jgi:hypothetical protein
MLTAEAARCDLDAVMAHYREFGYARLGKVCADDALLAMCDRSDDLMLGRVVYEGMFFQKDAPNRRYEDLVFGRGYEGPSLAYRKIEKLERDPLFSMWLKNDLFERVCRRVYTAPHIHLYRAVIFSKAAHGGSNLPWHQDAGNFWGLSEDPQVQIWTALDDAGEDAGCLEVIPRSHIWGLVSPLGGVVPRHRARELDAEATRERHPARAGDAILIHNYLWHRSGHNETPKMRRAFTSCYLSGTTRCLRTKKAPREFERVF